jgi:hypothetical protein
MHITKTMMKPCPVSVNGNMALGDMRGKMVDRGKKRHKKMENSAPVEE